MPEGFIGLAELLAPPAPPQPERPLETPPAIALSDDEENLGAAIRLFHARVAELVERAAATLLEDVAAGVLARELELKPADLQAIVDRALAAYASEEPLRVRVHPEEVSSLQCACAVRADASLRRGDAVIELREGEAVCTLGVRLAALLAR